MLDAIQMRWSWPSQPALLLFLQQVRFRRERCRADAERAQQTGGTVLTATCTGLLATRIPDSSLTSTGTLLLLAPVGFNPYSYRYEYEIEHETAYSNTTLNTGFLPLLTHDCAFCR
eukprot:scaffold218350_cov20-Prasinocladus_malaysianus.AAC.1